MAEQLTRTFILCERYDMALDWCRERRLDPRHPQLHIFANSSCWRLRGWIITDDDDVVVLGQLSQGLMTAYSLCERPHHPAPPPEGNQP